MEVQEENLVVDYIYPLWIGELLSSDSDDSEFEAALNSLSDQSAICVARLLSLTSCTQPLRSSVVNALRPPSLFEVRSTRAHEFSSAANYLL